MGYLAIFCEPALAGTDAKAAHPVDLLLTKFEDEATARQTIAECKTFLEEAMKIHGKKCEIALAPVSWFTGFSICLFVLSFV